MQDRYVGDVGDYVKLAILRALMPGERLGGAWWLYPDEAHNADGRHIGYLHSPGRWRSYDPDLFDGLAAVVADGRRRVQALQRGQLARREGDCPWVFPAWGKEGQKLQEVRRTWATAKRRAGLPADLRVHDLRHSFASALATQGIPLFEIGAVLGTGSCRRRLVTRTTRRSGWWRRRRWRRRRGRGTWRGRRRRRDVDGSHGGSPPSAFSFRSRHCTQYLVYCPPPFGWLEVVEGDATSSELSDHGVMRAHSFSHSNNIH